MSIFGGSVFAQGAQVPFAGLAKGEAQTVEVAADSLEIDQANNSAVFIGNVIIGIGDLRMAADRVEVIYATGDDTVVGAIEALRATGNVVFTSGSEAAESDTATYEIENGNVLMEGNVILTQGANALSGERLRIDLNAGTAVMEGRVQTIFQTTTGSE
ncbi:MAG: lipopolysaccharide transport periplasmic protein LptA [Rhodobacteraceae bacterium]|nr:lipopolysaccharide transport periplasmic protein LptA [Paracoccaceae bacterium]